MLQTINNSDEGIRRLCQEYLDAAVAGECDDGLDDIKHGIFETAMVYTFGEQVWFFMKEHLR